MKVPGATSTRNRPRPSVTVVFAAREADAAPTSGWAVVTSVTLPVMNVAASGEGEIERRGSAGADDRRLLDADVARGRGGDLDGARARTRSPGSRRRVGRRLAAGIGDRRAGEREARVGVGDVAAERARGGQGEVDLVGAPACDELALARRRVTRGDGRDGRSPGATPVTVYVPSAAVVVATPSTVTVAPAIGSPVLASVIVPADRARLEVVTLSIRIMLATDGMPAAFLITSWYTPGGA